MYVWTGVNTDKDIIHQVEKTEEGELRYKFFGTDWNLFDNKTSPLPYLSLVQRIRGEAQDVKLADIPEQNFNDLFMRGITRRTLSRLCAQAYERLGIFLNPMIAGLKLLLSRSCELANTMEIDKPLVDIDK